VTTYGPHAFGDLVHLRDDLALRASQVHKERPRAHGGSGNRYAGDKIANRGGKHHYIGLCGGFHQVRSRGIHNLSVYGRARDFDPPRHAQQAATLAAQRQG
jgi:hypothetical protein